MTIRDWQAHFEDVDVSAPHDLSQALRQVGKTTLGEPVPNAQLELLLAGIRNHLGLNDGHRCLDLGCGNGLLTARIAGGVREVLGLDFSEALLSVARTHYNPSNANYVCADLTRLPEDLAPARHFQRAFSCEVLQHLDVEGTERLLAWLATHVEERGRVLLCGIPDRERLRAFYNTDERWAYYQRRLAEGTEQIGTWWARQELATLAEQAGFAVRFVEQPTGLYTAHYRFDALLELP